nr:hypothetical protein Iba_chr10eCG12780 [Ipomoea batatas]
MEITEEMAVSEGEGSQEMESVEVVAETPLENQKAMACTASETDQVEGSPPAMADALNSVAPPAPSNPTGGPPARSYLDTVVGNGTNTDRAKEMEMPVQNQDVDRNVVNVGGETAARPSTKGSHPYGSWMIAIRQERRQQGGYAGQGRPNEGVMQRANSGKGKEIATGTGSRFALLGNAKENEEPEP